MRMRLVTVIATVVLGLGGSALYPASAAPASASTSASADSVQIKAAGFSAAGTWTAYQSNGAYAALTLTQDGNGSLSGSAASADGGYGTVSGFVDGSYIYFYITWSSVSHGRYIGSLQADRSLSGVTTDVNSPAGQVTWATLRKF
ncbi:hypothetical protein [Streptomyces sp. NPDC058457]|uniref:hypothetical protein n=1 Tax=Streptomyces sp. NPDC058457 TaxID=3346507 RepID=UPI00365C90C7